MSNSGEQPDPAPTAREPAPYASAHLGNVVAAVRELQHPRTIGRYTIISVIGEGGMGTVYRAEQREPIRRVVAIKIIKLGMDTREVIARFESERQALAVMDHPNVAKVLDAGATETGRPYFVMEYVAGEPITHFADRQKLTVRQRLELFVQACSAVQHAHQKGIIHRDLKPSNILVTLQDGKPSIKVIDFGVAKAIDRHLTEKTLFTETGQLIGTPEYMAPEQAEASAALDVDTRSDVYSLGVVLYELLSGALPFDSPSLRSAGYREIQRIIREVDPPRPSTRLSSLHDRLASIAACRQIDPKKLGTLVRGELDWIVMKAMEKERPRRYESASALAIDVMHFLADEPVSAGPPSRIYRARKFARRHRAALAGALVLAIAITGGLVGTTLGFINARHQRDQAIAARKAEAAANESQKKTQQFLTEMFTSIDPAEARGHDVLVKEVLDDASKRIDKEPPEHATVEASLRAVFGRAYFSLGMLDDSHNHLKRAVELYRAAGPDWEVQLMQQLHALGLTDKYLGLKVEAESSLREALRLSRDRLGPDHPDSIAAQATLGVILMQANKDVEADQMLSDALVRMKRSPNVDLDARVSVLNNLAFFRSQQGRYDEGTELFRSLLTEITAAQGEDHPSTIVVAANLAQMLGKKGDLAGADQQLTRALELSRKVNGPDHLDTLTISNNLALNAAAMGQFDRAEKIYLDLLERQRRTVGEDHFDALVTRGNYGLLLQSMHRYDEAAPIFRDVLDRMKRVNGPDHSDTLAAESNLAWLLNLQGDHAGAEAMYQHLLPRARRVFGPDHPVSALFGTKLGLVLVQEEKWAEAEPLLASGYAMANALGVADVQPDYVAGYGICLARLNKSREAVPILQRAKRAAWAMPRPDPLLLQRIADALALTGATSRPAAAPR